uniref:ATP synthase F0 subunit 8 n=1 Tax=Stegastes leucostictus TaxID=258452 RepID=UPI0028D6AA7F|nr:ATP synthase F0 subunit 8 [Stegastes leucostictus]WMY90530.1 ATP synthase F0 subunit 8 [Stegastes leucostictus]
MPQLNPAPWLSAFLFSWMIFLAVVSPKLLNYNFPNEPTPQATEKPKTGPWNWPWH